MAHVEGIGSSIAVAAAAVAAVLPQATLRAPELVAYWHWDQYQQMCLAASQKDWCCCEIAVETVGSIARTPAAQSITAAEGGPPASMLTQSGTPGPCGRSDVKSVTQLKNPAGAAQDAKLGAVDANHCSQQQPPENRAALQQTV